MRESYYLLIGLIAIVLIGIVVQIGFIKVPSLRPSGNMPNVLLDVQRLIMTCAIVLTLAMPAAKISLTAAGNHCRVLILLHRFTTNTIVPATATALWQILLNGSL